MKEGYMSSISSASNANAQYIASQKSLFSKLDTDQNGALSQDEFVSGRPKDVSEAQASKLYSKMDTSGSGALTEDQFDQGMASNRKPIGIEALVTADAMAVLMLMSQQGGQTFASDMDGPDGVPSAADIYNGMDTDGDGSVTQAEFLSARPDGMSADDATTLFNSIDTGATGSITEAQFADSFARQGAPAGEVPAGGGSGGGAASSGSASSDQVYDVLDTNKDGVVSEDEFLAAHPEDVTDKPAAAPFQSIDTQDTGSFIEQQFSDFMNGTGQAGTQTPAGITGDPSKRMDDLLSMLESISSGDEPAEAA
jgi:Ca2+-binding EF-hand superfamily protein